MALDALLSTIILVVFLVTIVIAIGSYAAYKLRERRRPRPSSASGDSAWFESIGADDLERADRERAEP
ncbi:MAG: hypothetical protein ACRELV_10040 [Longimicrobiales bacterium]